MTNINTFQGKVGVGTNNPELTQEIYTGNGSLYGLRLRRGSGAAFTDIGHLSTPGTEGLAIKTSDGNSTTQEVMRITGTGSVGIGTNNPAKKLHVEHYGSAIGDFEGIRIANHASLLHATVRPAYEFVVSDINSSTGIGNGKFAIGYRATTSASRTDRLVIDNSGNVGIGTTSPTGNLQITSDLANADDQINPVAQLVLHSSLAGLDDDGDIGSSLVFTQRWSDSDANSQGTMGSVHGFKDNSAGNYGGGLIFKSQPGSDTAPVERMRIDKDGNVGIGQTPSEKLSVNGDITVGLQGVIKRTANTDLIQIIGGSTTSSPNIFMTGHQRSSNPSNIGFRAGSQDVFQMYSSKIYTLNNVNFGINNTAPNLRFDNREKSRVSGWNFGIGHSSTNIANYIKSYGFAPNNASHFNKDFIVGGNERVGYFAVHGGGAASGSGNVQTARSAIFIISPYGMNFHWSRRLGDGQLQLEANGQFNGFRVQHSGFASYHSQYYEGWHQSGIAF